MSLDSTLDINFRNNIREVLSFSKNPLILWVGGWNDTVTILMLKKQLEKDFWLNQNSFDVMWVLPDCLDYKWLSETGFPLIYWISDESKRLVEWKNMKDFPEKILASHKDIFWISNVYGISNAKWTAWLNESLWLLLKSWKYDLVLACDVWWDFIASPDNHWVLSPLMDSYLLVALRELQRTSNIPFLYSVLWLWTDWESAPIMLDKALNHIDNKLEWTFDYQTVSEVADFYRWIVEPVRYSRTADFTIKEISWEWHPSPVPFRARFNIRPNPDSWVEKFYWYFDQTFDKKYYGKYYLFDSLLWVVNPYAVECRNWIEWFLKVQKFKTKVNHELNWQSYMDIWKVLWLKSEFNKSIFFWTPSAKFDDDTRGVIINKVVESVKTKIYDYAFVYTEDLKHEIESRAITQDISIIWYEVDTLHSILLQNLDI